MLEEKEIEQKDFSSVTVTFGGLLYLKQAGVIVILEHEPAWRLAETILHTLSKIPLTERQETFQ